jgi:hypothetical protein
VFQSARQSAKSRTVLRNTSECRDLGRERASRDACVPFVEFPPTCALRSTQGVFFRGRSDKSQILISVKILGARRRRRMVLLTEVRKREEAR